MSWDNHPPRLPPPPLNTLEYCEKIVDIYKVHNTNYVRHRMSNIILGESVFDWIFSIKLKKLHEKGYILNNL